MDSQRVYKYDTLRFLLICAVLLGHCIEQFPDSWVIYGYRLIYSFHMPAFLYLTGKFARFDWRRWLKHLVLPYAVFQTAYLIFAAKVLNAAPVSLQYTTPYWILWYLPVLAGYFLLLPILPRRGTAGARIAVGVSVLLALLAGFFDRIGYYLSLSRFFAFLPFFLWGHYSRVPSEAPGSLREKLSAVLAGVLLALAGEAYLFLGRYLLEAAGIQLPPYYQFLKEVESVIPAMNAQGYYSVSQGRYLPYEEASGQELEILTKYRELQYNALFEKPENRSTVFFPVYTQAEGTP